MPVYKFTQKKHMENFFHTGELRLGTLHDFNDVYSHGPGVADVNDGVHRIIRYVENEIIKPGVYTPGISDVIRISGNPVQFENVLVRTNRISPNGFLFSTARCFTESLFRRWFESDKYDAVYEITFPDEFIKAITDHISSSAFLRSFANAEYLDSQNDYRDQSNYHPAFVKVAEDYAWQVESRAFWLPRGPCGKLKPWFISVPLAVKYCRPFALLSERGVEFI